MNSDASVRPGAVFRKNSWEVWSAIKNDGVDKSSLIKVREGSLATVSSVEDYFVRPKESMVHLTHPGGYVSSGPIRHFLKCFDLTPDPADAIVIESVDQGQITDA